MNLALKGLYSDKIKYEKLTTNNQCFRAIFVNLLTKFGATSKFCLLIKSVAYQLRNKTISLKLQNLVGGITVTIIVEFSRKAPSNS